MFKVGENYTTRDGAAARCIARVACSEHPLVFAIDRGDREFVSQKREDGRMYGDISHPDDVMMPPLTQWAWFNVYKRDDGLFSGGMHLSCHTAIKKAGDCVGRVCVQLEEGRFDGVREQ